MTDLTERECKVPPEGWWCSRSAGHDGPCAARESDNRERATAARVIQAQRRAGLTGRALAQAAGITDDKLSKSLNGKRRFSSLELALISESTGVPVETLLGMKIDVSGWRQGYADAVRDATRALEQGRISHFLAECEPEGSPS